MIFKRIKQNFLKKLAGICSSGIASVSLTSCVYGSVDPCCAAMNDDPEYQKMCNIYGDINSVDMGYIGTGTDGDECLSEPYASRMRDFKIKMPYGVECCAPLKPEKNKPEDYYTYTPEDTIYESCMYDMLKDDPKCNVEKIMKLKDGAIKCCAESMGSTCIEKYLDSDGEICTPDIKPAEQNLPEAQS